MFQCARVNFGMLIFAWLVENKHHSFAKLCLQKLLTELWGILVCSGFGGHRFISGILSHKVKLIELNELNSLCLVIYIISGMKLVLFSSSLLLKLWGGRSYRIEVICIVRNLCRKYLPCRVISNTLRLFHLSWAKKKKKRILLLLWSHQSYSCFYKLQNRQKG